MRQAAARQPSTRQGKPVSPSAIFRWITDGVRVSANHRVRLEAIKHAGRFVTTPAALERFLAAQNPQQGDTPAGIVRTPHKRTQAHQRAVEALESQYGI